MMDCLIFDFDDTLCPERPFVAARLAAVARRLEERFGPVIDFERELLCGYEADLRANLFNTVLARAALAPDPQVIRELVDLYRGQPVCVKPYADAEPALALWSRHLPLALVTDGYGPTQRAKLESSGLGRYFRAVVFTHDLGPGGAKPGSAGFRRVRERLGFGGPAMVVGDNPALDFPGPKELGWRTVRIVRPGGKFAAVPAEGACQPDAVIRSLEELRTLDGLAGPLGGG